MADLEEDAFRIANYLYKNKIIEPNYIIVADLRDKVGLKSEEFKIADQFLRSARYVWGTMGEDEGRRWITPLGVHFVKGRQRHFDYPFAQGEVKKKKWTKGDTIAIIGVLIAIIAIIVSLFVPEVRRWLKLE